MNAIDFSDTRFEGVVAAGWIRDLESSDSRIHKEKVIEKKEVKRLDLVCRCV